MCSRRDSETNPWRPDNTYWDTRALEGSRSLRFRELPSQAPPGAAALIMKLFATCGNDMQSFVAIGHELCLVARGSQPCNSCKGVVMCLWSNCTSHESSWSVFFLHSDTYNDYTDNKQIYLNCVPSIGPTHKPSDSPSIHYMDKRMWRPDHDTEGVALIWSCAILLLL